MVERWAWKLFFFFIFLFYRNTKKMARGLHEQLLAFALALGRPFIAALLPASAAAGWAPVELEVSPLIITRH